MRFVSIPSFPKPSSIMRLAFLLAVQQGMCAETIAANHETPIKGRVQAVEFYDYQFPTLFVEGSGSGNATHLGRFTATYEFVVDLPTLAGSGSAHFIAANGDNLFTEVSGQANPTADPDVAYVVETYTIVGGTGRFDGATGEFTVERWLNTVTGVTYGSFRGTLIK